MNHINYDQSQINNLKSQIASLNAQIHQWYNQLIEKAFVYKKKEMALENQMHQVETETTNEMNAENQIKHILSLLNNLHSLFQQSSYSISNISKAVDYAYSTVQSADSNLPNVPASGLDLFVKTEIAKINVPLKSVSGLADQVLS